MKSRSISNKKYYRWLRLLGILWLSMMILTWFMLRKASTKPDSPKVYLKSLERIQQGNFAEINLVSKEEIEEVPDTTTPVPPPQSDTPRVSSSTEPTLRFFIVGDWGNGGARRQVRVARSMESWATRFPPHFIVSTGDNMYDTGVASVHDKQFHKTFEHVYDIGSLKTVPWYMSLGNHDHGYHEIVRDVMAQVNYTRLSKKWIMLAPYYRVIPPAAQNLAEFFILDTYEKGKDMMTDTQVRWFENALSTSTAPWKVVIGHRAIYSAGRIHGSSKFLQHNVLPAMEKYKSTLYWAGDDHNLQVLKHKGTHIFVSGTGSRTNPHLVPCKQSIWKAVTLGFMIATMNRTHTIVQVINATSNEVVWTEVVTAPTP
eukprot:PhF_6_TR13378/c0_g2_i1/m.21240/K14379/ACP5; tartrate-resistant acid phosphatase type 5